MDVKDKKILVIGLGRSGIAAVRALVAAGALVSVQDNIREEDADNVLIEELQGLGVKLYFEEMPQGEIYDVWVLSPGVSAVRECVIDAEKEGAEIIGELELAYKMGKGTYVAITGTNGKTTTTSWVHQVLTVAGIDARLVGNIGLPAVTEAVQSEEDTWLVTEVSSFQLETIDKFKPKVSAILNLTPDHMDRHKTMKNYGSMKARIFKNQGEEDFVVVNFDDKQALRLCASTKATIVPFSTVEDLPFGAFVKNDEIVIRNRDEKIVPICSVNKIQLPGSHNLENALAAVAISYFAGIDPEAITEGILSFRGVEHRIEMCGNINGVKYINDSKATNISAAIKALEAIKGPVILIAGGYDKGAEFDELIGAFGNKVKHALLLGATAAKIKDAAEAAGFTHTTLLPDMENCVKEAARVALPGDTVLLSPACASWDMYKNFEERGHRFKECIKHLSKG